MLSIIFNTLKKIFLFYFFFGCVNASAQQFNFKRYGIGLSTGVTHAFTDVPEMKIAPSIVLTADYFITPFVSTYLDLQFGNIKGGSKEVDFANLPNKHGREFSNSYLSATLNTRLALGQLVYYEDNRIVNAIKGLYLGLGVGLIQNNVKNVRVQPLVQPNQTVGYVFPGVNNSTNVTVPLNVGINFEIKDSWSETRYILGVNYQSNLTFGEGLDGYNDPPEIFENNGFDMYNMGTISFKYCFGPSHGFYRP